MDYCINNRVLSYTADGEKRYGSDEVLLDKDEDLTALTTWRKTGFTIEQLYSKEDYTSFLEETYALLINLWKSAGISIPAKPNLERYHEYVTNQSDHLKAVEKTKLITTDKFPLGITKLENRISKLCNVSLEVRNPFDEQSIFHFRVIRPLSKDNNPLHRDVWLEDYKSCINLYIPIAGSNELSSLIIFPESHHWPESKVERTVSGAIINGVKFNVPAVTDIKGKYSIARPNPSANEVLIFSPYLIHGGSVNLNSDSTRISIEIRLWKKQQVNY